MKICELLSILRRLAPEDTALEGDPVGLLIAPASEQLRSVVVCLDATEHVVRTAIDEGASLIVAHHPLIYHPLKRLDREEPVSAHVCDLVRAGVGLYAMHTNWDAADNGINDTLAEVLGLINVARLQGSPEARLGRAGQVSRRMEPKAFLEDVAERLSCGGSSALRWSTPAKECEIELVAVCGGAGAMLVGDAIRAGADALVTADVRHHEFIDAAERGLMLIDAGHEATEAPGMQKLARTLTGLIQEIYVNFCPNEKSA